MADGKPAPPFRIRMRQAGDTLVVEVSGELDNSQADLFALELREAFTGHAGSVLLDLSEVGLIDSTGLRALLLLSDEAASSGDRLRIRRSLNPAVGRALALTGLTDRLPWVLGT
jgi:anti-sigma B factor antagonist